MAASSWREPSPPPKLVEVKCKTCRRLLCKVDAERALVEVVCPDKRCKRYQRHDLHRAPK